MVVGGELSAQQHQPQRHKTDHENRCTPQFFSKHLYILFQPVEKDLLQSWFENLEDPFILIAMELFEEE